MRKPATMILAALAAANLWAIQGTITTETDSKTGEIKWHARNKQYVMSIKNKSGTAIDMEFKLADVVKLDIVKPAEFDKAVKLYEDGKYPAAIELFSKVVAEYRMLQWDKPAGRYLALSYIKSGKPQNACDECEKIISQDRSAAYSGDLAFAYWQSLLALGKNDQLEANLKKASASGDRQSSAAALVMRGDMIVQKANKAPDELRRALRDGYLRVVLMYNDPACARERADAIMKAAACFDDLGQASRAQNLKSMLQNN